MAKTETTVRGYVYTVTSPNGGTVTDAEGKLNKPVNAGDQVTVQAPSDALTCDDDDAVIFKVNFKAPLLALRLLGQGETALPAGYTRLAFLESTGTQRIQTGLPATNLTCVEVEFADVQNDNWAVPVSASGTNAYNIFAKGSIGGVSRVPRFDYGTSQVLASQYNVSSGRHTMRKEAERNFIDGVEVSSNAATGSGTWANINLLYFGTLATFMSCKLFRYKKYELGGPVQQHFVPAIDATGTPCMFDLVSKQPFRNAGSGQFVAGVGTAAQLSNLLRNLPPTGGALTLTLPAEANTPEVAEALQACHDTKGWTLTVHEYRPAAAATYSLRRVRSVVWCSPSPCEHGSYVDNFGTRWLIDRCAAIFGALGQDPAAYGYTPFDSVEQAAEHWALQPYVDPEAMDETMGDNGTLEQGGTENTSPTTNS